MKNLSVLCRILILAVVILFAGIITIAEAQNVIPIPPHNLIYSNYSRGFWFTAPCDLLITGIRAPADFSTNAQTIHLVRFSAPPPAYPSVTTAFNTIFYSVNIADTGFVNLNFGVSAGEHVGILAVRNNGSGGGQTSYSTQNSPVSSSIGPYPVTLYRLGWQGNIINSAATDFWTEAGLPIGRAEIRYVIQQPLAIPVPPHSSTYSNQARGYWFTAPCNMWITGVRAPDDFSTNPQTIHLVKFPSAPAAYPALTTTFTTLFYGSNISGSGFVGLSAYVNAGEHIGVLAVRDNGSGNCITSYTQAISPVSSSIGGHAISLERLGHQGNIITAPAPNFWTESGSFIGRAEIRYEFPNEFTYLPPGLIANSFPFYETPTGNNKRQWIHQPSLFPCVPPGYITRIYLKAAGPVNSNLTGFLVRMGLSNLTAFTSGTFMAPLDTVLYASSLSLSSISGDWIPITLQKPYYYDGTSSLVTEVSHQGCSPGFYIMQTTLTNGTIFGNSSNASGTLHDRLAALQLEIATYQDASLEDMPSITDSLCEGGYPITVVLKNNSPVTIMSADIGWAVNGITQPVFNWTGNLLPGAITQVTIGNYLFPPGTGYQIHAFVKNPNNMDDRVVWNDTIKKTVDAVIPYPSVFLGNDTSLRAGSSIQLDAGPGFSSYDWSTGATTQTIMVDTTGHGFGGQIIWVHVLQTYQCWGGDTIIIFFVDDSGLEEAFANGRIQVVPNPNNGRFDLLLSGLDQGDYRIELVSPDGKKIWKKELTLSRMDERIMIDPVINANGIYLLNISGGKSNFVRKVMVLR